MRLAGIAQSEVRAQQDQHKARKRPAGSQVKEQEVPKDKESQVKGTTWEKKCRQQDGQKKVEASLDGAPI